MTKRCIYLLLKMMKKVSAFDCFPSAGSIGSHPVSVQWLMKGLVGLPVDVLTIYLHVIHLVVLVQVCLVCIFMLYLSPVTHACERDPSVCRTNFLWSHTFSICVPLKCEIHFGSGLFSLSLLATSIDILIFNLVS